MTIILSILTILEKQFYLFSLSVSSDTSVDHFDQNICVDTIGAGGGS
jgi:hypothetical protein